MNNEHDFQVQILELLAEGNNAPKSINMLADEFGFSPIELVVHVLFLESINIIHRISYDYYNGDLYSQFWCINGIDRLN